MSADDDSPSPGYHADGMALPAFIPGHSTRSLDDFLALLEQHDVALLLTFADSQALGGFLISRASPWPSRCRKPDRLPSLARGGRSP